MNGLTPYVVGFVACVGALLGGGHGAILATTIILGVVLVVSLIGAVRLAKQAAAAQAELAEALKQGGADWTGVPDVDLTDRLQTKLPENDKLL